MAGYGMVQGMEGGIVGQDKGEGWEGIVEWRREGREERGEMVGTGYGKWMEGRVRCGRVEWSGVEWSGVGRQGGEGGG